MGRFFWYANVLFSLTCPPAISHRNTRCVDRAGKYFLDWTLPVFFMTENPALRQRPSHPRKATPSSGENDTTGEVRKASGKFDNSIFC